MNNNPFDKLSFDKLFNMVSTPGDRSDYLLLQSVWNAALMAAQAECMENAKRPHPYYPDAVGARNCLEIKDAIRALESNE